MNESQKNMAIYLGIIAMFVCVMAGIFIGSVAAVTKYEEQRDKMVLYTAVTMSMTDIEKAKWLADNRWMRDLEVEN
ncbi:MAG: hypothetical protein ACTSW1_08405 [Candidatus Hodarchaeales archaeon]